MIIYPTCADVHRYVDGWERWLMGKASSLKPFTHRSHISLYIKFAWQSILYPFWDKILKIKKKDLNKIFWLSQKIYVYLQNNYRDMAKYTYKGKTTYIKDDYSLFIWGAILIFFGVATLLSSINEHYVIGGVFWFFIFGVIGVSLFMGGSGQMEEDRRQFRVQIDKEIQMEKERIENEEKWGKQKEINKKKYFSEIEKAKKWCLVQLGKFNESSKVEDINSLLSKHQEKIQEIGNKYLLDVVKLTSYIKKQEKDIRDTLEGELEQLLISDSFLPSKNNSYEVVEKLKKHTEDYIKEYNLLVFHTLNMIGAVIKNDMVTFFEIHNMFDKMKLFYSDYELEMLKTSREQNKALKQKEKALQEGLMQLADSMESSIYGLQSTIQDSLQEVNSSIGYNNLVTTINAYQNYKINKKLSK